MPALTTAMPGGRHRFVYIVNSYAEREASHFAHTGALLEALVERGVEVLLVIERAGEAPRLVSNGITVRTLRRGRFPLKQLELLQLLGAARHAGYQTIFVRVSIRAALVAVVARFLWGVRVLYWQSGTTHESDRAQHGVQKLAWFLGTHLPFVIVRHGVDSFVTGPHAMLDYYAQVAGVPRTKLRLLHNDIDVRRFGQARLSEVARAGRLRALGLAPGSLVVLFVHRLSPVRRTLYYLPWVMRRVHRALPECRVAWIIAGSGPDLPALERRVSEERLTGRVVFLGDVPNMQIQELYSVADVFIQPSYVEGFPRVILEAMAANLPIVTTDAGGTRELVGERQARFVVPRDDRDGFAASLIAILRSRELRAALAAENVAHVERFATSRVVEQYLELLFGSPLGVKQEGAAVPSARGSAP
jgi:glycosyltransferase involved in cell wall biosynthesis